MFNLFRKKKIDVKMPADYTHLLDKNGYAEIIGLVSQYFNDKGEKVLTIHNGIVSTAGEGENGTEVKYGLDNLVRAVAGAPKADWEAIIYTHFNKMGSNIGALNYYKKDYDEAKPYLKILIKPVSILQDDYKKLVYKTVIPGTCCILIFDHDNKLTYLFNETVAEWNKTTDELFEQALANIKNEEIEIYTIDLKEEGETENSKINTGGYVFLHGDFAAPVLLNIEENASFAVGKYGAITAIPAKGAAIAVPINNKEVFKYLNALTKLTLSYFEENQGNITPSLYWYYNGRFEMFPEAPSKEKKGYVTVSVPHNLSQLVNEE